MLAGSSRWTGADGQLAMAGETIDKAKRRRERKGRKERRREGNVPIIRLHIHFFPGNVDGVVQSGLPSAIPPSTYCHISFILDCCREAMVFMVVWKGVTNKRTAGRHPETG
jgi:hypothetical protein